MLCLGLMSGTSMDGIDVAIIDTDGHATVASVASGFYPFPPEFQQCMKFAERLVKHYIGDLEETEKHFCIPPGLESVLKKLFAQYQLSDITFTNLIELSTRLHAGAAQQLMHEHGIALEQIELVGYHGQTLFHAPNQKKTVQVGDAQLLANLLNVPVVADFRLNDVAHGGQGAPLTPIYHWVLAKYEGLIPVAVLNCGGIANVSFILEEDPEKLLAFDTGPGNVLIDRFVREKTQETYFFDKDGQWGLAGSINAEAFAALMESALPKGYLSSPPPKSLDSHDCRLPDMFHQMSLEDGCATLAAFSAECMVKSLDHCPHTLPSRWVLAGGGWYNPAILTQFKQRLEARLTQVPQILTAKQMGWQQDALEAEAFAYLAKRVELGLPLSFPGTTGVDKPLTGGKIFNCNL